MKVPVLSPKIPIYKNNGLGRDTYISFYNGGFGSYKYSRSYKKDYYQIPIHRNHPDLFKRRPIDRYQMSGEGREYFIFKGIQSEHDRNSNNNSFENSLRKGENSPAECSTSKKRPRNRFEKTLINRIFYGKCPGMKDRQMSPKVKFKKEIKKEKEENNSGENSFLKTEENRVSNNTSLRNTFLKTSGFEKDNIINLKQFNTKKKYELMFTPIYNNRRIKLIVTRNNEKDDNNLINSVKKIFLYNSRNRFDTEIL